MASAEEPVGAPATDDSYAYVENEEKPGPETPVPENHVTPNQPKVKEEGKKETEHNNIKSTILVSGAAAAFIGAIFAIAKKFKKAT